MSSINQVTESNKTQETPPLIAIKAFKNNSKAFRIRKSQITKVTVMSQLRM
jgi:hypothetical protein